MRSIQNRLTVCGIGMIFVGANAGLNGCSKGGVLNVSSSARLPNAISAEAAKAIEASKVTVQADALRLFPGQTIDPIPVQLWRMPLTDVSDVYEWLFGAGAVIKKGMTRDEKQLGIDRLRADLSKAIRTNWYEKYLDVGQTTADLDSSKLKLKSVFTCAAADTNDACFAKLKDKVLSLLFMGKLTPEQTANYKIIFDKVATSATEQDNAVHAVVKAALRSPYFLFIRDLGGDSTLDTEASKLTGTENLAFLGMSSTNILESMKSFVGPMPDLSSAVKRKSYLNTVLKSPSGVKAIAKFYGKFGAADSITELTKNTTLFKSFTPKLAADMSRQIDLTLQRVIGSEGSSAVELMSSKIMWMSPELAPLYGYSGKIPADGFVTVNDRAGYWSMAGVQATMSGVSESKPMLRAKTFLTTALCKEIGEPPPVTEIAKETDAKVAVTIREQFDAIGARPACASCHRNLNPFGLSMEMYNAEGRVRTAYESGNPVLPSIDSTSKYIAQKSYKNAAEVFEATAVSPDYWQCVVKQAFKHATGLKPEGYDPILRNAYVSFVNSDFNMRELFVNLLADEALQSRGGSK